MIDESEDSIFIPKTPSREYVNPSEEELRAYEASVGFRFPDDARSSFMQHAGRGVTGGMAAEEEASYVTLGPILDVPRGGAGYPILDTFENWVGSEGFVLDVATEWVTCLVEVIGGSHGAYYFDFAFDEVAPPLVYVDMEWDNYCKPITVKNFRGVLYVAESFTAAIMDRRIAEDETEPTGPFNRVQFDEWIDHRNRMLGLV